MAKKKAPKRVHSRRVARPKASSSKKSSAEVDRDQPGPIKPGWSTSNPVVERREVDGVIYQLEWVSCGKPRCGCSKDSPYGRRVMHGPYWYAYKLARRGGGAAEGRGRWVSKYIGKEFKELR